MGFGTTEDMSCVIRAVHSPAPLEISLVSFSKEQATFGCLPVCGREGVSPNKSGEHLAASGSDREEGRGVRRSPTSLPPHIRRHVPAARWDSLCTSGPANALELDDSTQVCEAGRSGPQGRVPQSQPWRCATQEIKENSLLVGKR